MPELCLLTNPSKKWMNSNSAVSIKKGRSIHMITCNGKELLLRQLRELKPSDPEFSQKFDGIVQKLKVHMISGHPAGKHRDYGIPCRW
jgi:hypothetical protein